MKYETQDDLYSHRDFSTGPWKHQPSGPPVKRRAFIRNAVKTAISAIIGLSALILAAWIASYTPTVIAMLKVSAIHPDCLMIARC